MPAGRMAASWRLIKACLPRLLLLNVGAYVPLYGAYALAVASGWLPEEAADKLFGIVGALVMPIINAAMVSLIHQANTGQPIDLTLAIRTGRQAWSRLLAAYLAMSLFIVAMLALTCLPAFLVMKYFQWEQPWPLVAMGAVTLGIILPRFAFLDPLIVVGEASAYEARRRSAELSAGRRPKILGWGLLLLGPPLLLETLSDIPPEWTAKVLSLDLDAAKPYLSAGLGLVASFLYIGPTTFFYLYYRELVAAKALNHDPCKVP